MSMNTKLMHTPTPWFRGTPGSEYQGLIQNRETMEVIGRTYAEIDADYIVRAVNAYEFLMDMSGFSEEGLQARWNGTKYE